MTTGLRMRIKSARTMNVYGRLRATLTIHIVWPAHLSPDVRPRVSHFPITLLKMPKAAAKFRTQLTGFLQILGAGGAPAPAGASRETASDQEGRSVRPPASDGEVGHQERFRILAKTFSDYHRNETQSIPIERNRGQGQSERTRRQQDVSLSAGTRKADPASWQRMCILSQRSGVQMMRREH